MNTVVLDTDTLSAIMRQDSTAVSVAQQYLKTHQTLTISLITRFEILRGLIAKNAASQISAFHATCVAMQVLPLNDAIIVRAAEIEHGKTLRMRLPARHQELLLDMLKMGFRVDHLQTYMVRGPWKVPKGTDLLALFPEAL